MHRRRVGSSYTIIVTPEFSRGVLGDISRDRSVVVKSATLSNYLYQGIARYGRNLSYADLHGIVSSNYGKDITESVNELMFAIFGHSCVPKSSTTTLLAADSPSDERPIVFRLEDGDEDIQRN